MVFRYVSIVLLIIFSLKTNAQIDREFWFAAPEVSIGSSNFDKPILLRLSSYNKTSTITIDQPANPSFIPIIKLIPANDFITVDLTAFISTIENSPPNTISNYGIHISSTNRISAYYEVASAFCNCNPEIFSLKGSNGLGTDFLIPAQDTFRNSPSYTPTPYSSFEIAATQDSTDITIIPSNNIVGHTVGIPYIITLNKGQTYSVRASSQLALNHLGGSIVQSNKPIAITITDDLVIGPGSCADLMGDQIIPTNKLGKEYVAVKGFLNNGDYVFIMAIQNNTIIYIDGITSPIDTLNRGEIYKLHLTNDATHIKSDSLISVLHMTGFGCELGQAILPPLECNGSSQVSFARTTSENFGLIIFTPSGSEDAFVLNGNSTIITPSDFDTVPGTNGTWMHSRKTMSTLQVPVNTPNIVKNTKARFHLGIINGGTSTGCRYGYFSNFSGIGLGENFNFCSGDTATLFVDILGGTTLWNTGSTADSILIIDSGTYWVTNTSGTCILTDSIYAAYIPLPALNIGNDTIICQEDSLILTSSLTSPSYLWQNGNVDSFQIIQDTGLYWLQTSYQNCEVYDTIRVMNYAYFGVSLGNDTFKCDYDSLNLIPNGDFDSYLWNTSSTDKTIWINIPGEYILEVTDSNNCSYKDSVSVDNIIFEEDFGFDTTICQSFQVEFNALNNGFSHTWSNGTLNQTIIVEEAGIYVVDIQNKHCNYQDSFFLITDQCDIKIEIPTAFTPNNDGNNDYWEIFYFNLEELYSLIIFNRWGEIVFRTNDPINFWDGKSSNGKEYEAGTYIYQLAAVDIYDKEVKMQGTVSLIR